MTCWNVISWKRSSRVMNNLIFRSVFSCSSDIIFFFFLYLYHWVRKIYLWTHTETMKCDFLIYQPNICQVLAFRNLRQVVASSLNRQNEQTPDFFTWKTSSTSHYYPNYTHTHTHAHAPQLKCFHLTLLWKIILNIDAICILQHVIHIQSCRTTDKRQLLFIQKQYFFLHRFVYGLIWDTVNTS